MKTRFFMDMGLVALVVLLPARPGAGWGSCPTEPDPVPLTYTIQADAETGGTITPSGSVTITKGGSVSFDLTPDTNYGILDVLVDGESVGTPADYLFSDVRQDHSIRAFFSITPLLPLEGGLLDDQQDLTEDWEDDLLAGQDLTLPREAVESLLGPGAAPGAVEILGVHKVVFMDCSLAGSSGSSLRVGLEDGLPEPAPGAAWGLLLHDPEKDMWELQKAASVSVEDGSPFDQDQTEGKIDILLAEVELEATDAGGQSNGSGGCNTGLNPLPAILLLIFHYLKPRA